MEKEEAMEILKGFHDESATFSVRAALETLHPELKEGEDERTRKAILTGLIDCRDAPDLGWSNFGGINIDECIAWIKKQGKIDEDLIAKKFLINKGYPIDANGTFPTYEELYNIIREGLENQSEQKLTDEPKFKVGDWVFIEEVKGYKNGPFQIKTVDSFGYSFDEYHTIPFMYEELLSKWTIQDAKQGDVLYHKAENGIEYIVMNKGLNEFNNIDSYFRYNSINGFNTDIPSVLSAKCDSITPATKEQRDFLFQKMKEDGYEWNAERKELKKIEDEEYNGEDYGIDSLYHAQRILEKTLGSVDGYQTDDGILSHQCAISAVKKLYEQKPSEWSEEDENRINRLIAYFEDKESFTAEDDIVYANWLKSLKERCAWKPSEEQMDALNSARWNAPFNIEILDSLYNDLKKLTE